MTRFKSAWLPGALALIAALVGGVQLLQQGPAGPDLAITRGLQDIVGAGTGWAELLTQSAKAPLLFGSIALAAGLAALASGWRIALGVPLAYGFAWLADKALRAIIYSPKPDAELVNVASASSASGLPSTFALVYGSLFGVALLAPASRAAAMPVRFVAALLILAGCAARVVLGGHWGSQMLASACLGLLFAWLAIVLVRRLAPGLSRD